MKNLSLIIIFFTMCSCGGDLNVSVLNPLPKEIVDKYSAKDTLFGIRYDIIRKIVDSAYRSDSRINSITYSDLFTLQKNIDDVMTDMRSDTVYLNQWKSEYGNTLNIFAKDSVKFTSHMVRNDFKNYFDFEIIKFYEQDSWVRTCSKADIRIIPKNGHKIRKLLGSIYLETIKDSNRSDKYHPVAEGAYFSFRGMKTTPFVVEATDVGRTGTLYDVIDIPVNIVKQKYNIKFNVSELIVDDQYIDVNLDSIPLFARLYLTENDRLSKYLYIISNIDKEYKTFGMWLRFSAEESLKEKYSKEFEFYENGSDILSQNN